MWLAKLKRMMDELPDKYLEPKPLEPEDKLLLSLNAKPIGQITEEEKRLYGVSRRLEDAMVLEEEAHQALHIENEDHSSELYERLYSDMERRRYELMTVVSVLLMSLGERLGHDNAYMIDGDDVYAISPPSQAPPLMVMPLGPMSES